MKRPPAVTDLIEELKRMPGIGQKTAERLSFFVMRGSNERANKLADAVRNIKEKIILCSQCHGITEINPCEICRDPKRDPSIVCVVEEPHDVYAMENMGHFRGVYHVLMGVISPLDGIGPSELTIEALKERVMKDNIQEVVLATNPDMEGESTAVYIAKILKPANIKVTRIARGLPVGGDIEYADEVTLLKSLEGRTEMK
ncbi:MAG TPA: recombination mediator RecR [Nitrospinaceae bacterium]|jgi:recombination protein RecR|nr:recombination mediator RecR [Nitrospinaceae bacterium]HJL72981.1 recombination mediator RecR [Nitrospinaceae bacterium]HJN99352.1 recombination mediator RecR [Nitrospinaceae bacterium]|tara:strand:+ start:1935 stop:2534 length:600 start_codon:yes stop_codon:yes gene_type:complete